MPYRNSNPKLRKLILTVQSFLLISVILGTLIGYLRQHYPLLLIGIAIALVVLSAVAYGLAVGPFRRFVYYRIGLWLVGRYFEHDPPRRGFSWLVRFLFTDDDLHWAKIILSSRRFHEQECATGLNNNGIYSEEFTAIIDPVARCPVVRREHLPNMAGFKYAAFSIVLLFNQIKLTRKEGRKALEVDLRGQSCAIYNNYGKRFLFHKYLTENKKVQYQKSSDSIHRFLMSEGEDKTESFQFDGLRWASGGGLPVARTNSGKKKWVCLFFRDIYPLGWNIANGASETKREYKDLNALLHRELVEELVICDGEPNRNASLKHRMLNFPQVPEKFKEKLDAKKLSLEHDRLRRQHDEMIFEQVQGPDIRQCSGANHDVVVNYDDPAFEKNQKDAGDVFLAINPLELGIEVVRVCEFDLGETEYLLDGEVNGAGPTSHLVRRPILLLDVEYLRKRFEEKGTLGDPVSDEQSLDCRSLGHIPPKHIKLFSADINLRRKRLADLNSDGAKTNEQQRIEQWLEQFEQPFEEAGQHGLTGTLSQMLPVTWKILELALKRGVI